MHSSLFRRSTLAVQAVSLLLCGLAAAAEPAAKKHPLSVEDLWKVKRTGAPALSPDGKWVAVEVTTYSMEDNDSTSDLWLLSSDGKMQRRLTAHKGKNSGPAWSPDGKQIAFISKRGGDHAQVQLITPDGGEAVALTDMPMAPSGLKWAPDGKTLYCIARTWPETPDDASYKKKAKEAKDSKVKASIIDDALYRYWDDWLSDGKKPVLFAVDVATGKHRNLFTHTKLHLPAYQTSASHYDVSPDGKELCFVADTVKEIGTDFNLDLYTMPLDKAGDPKNITAENTAADTTPVYAPDGNSIAFTRQTIKFFYADRSRIMLYDRASGKSRELTEKFDRTCGTPKWGHDSRKLYFEAEDKGYVRVFSVSAKGNDVTPLTSGFSDHNLDVSRDGTMLAFSRSSFDLPPTVFVAPSSDPVPRQIDRFNDGLVSTWDLGQVKEVYFKGAGDAEVQMWIVYPPGFDAKKKWPLLQVVHGGPHNGITTDFSFRWNLQLFASKGYVVSCINFHGSSGFGQAFTDSITGDMATKPYTDVMKGTDYMEAQPYIDKTRMAAAGGSYGGFMMAWLNGHTDRFKAMVCHAGVYNWHSMMASDVVRSRERPLGAMPWGDLSKIDKQSPQRFANHFKTPTLVVHGEKDFRVPVTQGMEYYNTLRIKGVPTRFLYYPDENHWVLKPQNSRLWYREFFAWLDKYIGHGPT
ncbi:MAG: S9 family peptidase [Gemmataceae bacterium]|nr:S9 family peptidase [Gemmataceae bacterium]